MRPIAALALLLIFRTSIPSFAQQMGGTGILSGTANIGGAAALNPAPTGQYCNQLPTSGTSISCTMSTTAGDTVVWLVQYSSGVTATPTISCGTATSPRPAMTWNGGATYSVLYYAVNVSASSTCTVGASYSANTGYPRVWSYGAKNANAATPLDESSCGSGNNYCYSVGNGRPVTSSAITTANTNELVLSFYTFADAGNTSTSTAGYTLAPASTGQGLAYALQNTTGSYSVTWTNDSGNGGSSQNYIIVNLALRN